MTSDDIPDEVDGIPSEYGTGNTIRQMFQFIDDGRGGAYMTEMFFSEKPFPWGRDELECGAKVSEWEIL